MMETDLAEAEDYFLPFEKYWGVILHLLKNKLLNAF